MIDVILLVLACICFALDAFTNISPRVNLTALGVIALGSDGAAVMARFGRLFLTPMGRWSWTRALHRVVHRDPYEACFICRSVWAYLETEPGFIGGIRQGEADIRAGRTVRWEDVR